MDYCKLVQQAIFFLWYIIINIPFWAIHVNETAQWCRSVQEVFIPRGDIYEILWNTCQIDVAPCIQQRDPITLSSHHHCRPFFATLSDLFHVECGLEGCDARPVINVSMSPGKQANEKSLSQAYPDPTRVSGGATSYEIKLITPPCEGVINNPRAPNIAPPELTDWGALHQPRRDLPL